MQRHGPTRTILNEASAQVGVAETLGIALLILVPLGFFALLWIYLRRVAPGGSVPEPEGESAPAPRPATGEPGAESGRVRTQTCPRCTVTVRPHTRGSDVAECPNCGAPLFVQTTP